MEQSATFFHKNSYIELSQDALIHNTSQYRTILGSDAIIALVIKGNAYGHGMHEIARMAETISDINMLCTFLLSEALSLVQIGITKPIMIMGYNNDDCKKAINTNIQWMVGSYNQLDELNEIGCQNNYQFPIHIKIDTGLSRFGFYPHEYASVIQRCKTMRGIVVVGACTHLAEKNTVHSSFSAGQLHNFLSLIQAFDMPAYIHATTTTDALLFKRNACNLFRIGAGLYGYLPSKEIADEVQKRFPGFNLRPIFKWKAPIIAIKELSPGTSIGYDRTYIAPKPMRIGIIPIGYSNGFSSAFAQMATVYWCNEPLSVVGVVPMNSLMIDITDYPTIGLFTQITLFNNHTAQTLITKSWNIRTILCGISPCIQRIITQNETIAPAIFTQQMLQSDLQDSVLYPNPYQQKTNPLKGHDQENS